MSCDVGEVTERLFSILADVSIELCVALDLTQLTTHVFLNADQTGIS